MASYGSRPTSGKRSAEFQGEIRAERSTPSSRDGVETASAFRGEISCSWQKFCDENNPCYFRHISRPLAPQGANAVLKPYARVGPSAWPTCRANEHPAPVVYRVPWGRDAPHLAAGGTQQAKRAHLPVKSACQLALRVRQVYRQRARLGGPKCALRSGETSL